MTDDDIAELAVVAICVAIVVIGVFIGLKERGII